MLIYSRLISIRTTILVRLFVYGIIIKSEGMLSEILYVIVNQNVAVEQFLMGQLF